MKMWKLVKELANGGWPNDRKLLILAARYYLGLETVDTLRVNAKLSPNKINFILYNR